MYPDDVPRSAIFTVSSSPRPVGMVCFMGLNLAIRVPPTWTLNIKTDIKHQSDIIGYIWNFWIHIRKSFGVKKNWRSEFTFTKTIQYIPIWYSCAWRKSGGQTLTGSFSAINGGDGCFFKEHPLSGFLYMQSGEGKAWLETNANTYQKKTSLQIDPASD